MFPSQGRQRAWTEPATAHVRADIFQGSEPPSVILSSRAARVHRRRVLRRGRASHKGIKASVLASLPTSENSVNAKFNLGEFIFHALW